MAEQRPDPDKLLQRAQEAERHEKRGKLKIYLGAAPGVGKTYEMLHDALDEREKGLDVVIGVVESHGRQEIEALLKDFNILHKQSMDYHGKTLYEFDLDGALKRHPALILMDEMAHTNAPGLRHKKRWQDIKELLDRGIDVYTTLNVQHIESLNDDVASILHAPVKETVPDSMIEMADTIELIDIPPEDLIKRLHEGKVYIPRQASLAADHFFRKGNLTALRELALRATANRVGAQVLLYRQDLGIKHVWASREKILVCVGSGPGSLKLIRAAKRIATNLKTAWMAVYVDTPKLKLSEELRNLALQNLRVAEQLGAETRVLTGTDIVKEVMDFAHEQNITLIMLWKHIRNRWRNLFFRSLADEIVRNSGEVDVYIMTGTAEKIVSSGNQPDKKTFSWRGYIISLAIVGVATVINFILFPYMRPSSFILLYLLGITVVAAFGQVGPSILASVLSVLACGYFFISPYNIFAITDIQYLFTLLVMLVVSQVISQLTILTRRQAEAARLMEHQTSALYTLSRQLASARGTDKLINVGITYISNVFDCEVIVLMPKKGHLAIRARSRTIQDLSEKEHGIAQWVYELGQMAGLGTESLTFTDSLYLPLLGSHNVLGVLRIHPANPDQLSAPERMHLLVACVGQISLAVEVDRLQEQTKVSELQIETDRVRSALLQAVSHDLRAPLIAISGAATTQMEMAKELDPHAIEKLGMEIYIESEQLSRLINNLLKITYFDAEQISLEEQLLSLKELVANIIKMAGKKLGKRKVKIDIADDLPLIPCDSVLLTEVFVNLIDNAVKFTSDNTSIGISAEADKEKVSVSVIDHGPGISPDEVNQLFEKFYRGRLTEQRGLGLGLAICRSIVKAHGGEIWAENGKDGGAVFKFTLPLIRGIK